MGEILPDGRIQGYSMLCNCGATVPVNIQGEGTCPRCDARLPQPKPATQEVQPQALEPVGEEGPKCREAFADLDVPPCPGCKDCQPEDERESTEEVPTVLVTLTADEAQAILSPNRYMDTVRGGRQRSLAERAKAKISTAMECAPPFDLDEFEREKASILRWLEQFAPATQSEQSHTEEGKRNG